MPAFITIEDRKLMKIIDDLIILFGGPGMEAWLAADIGPYLAKRAGERFAQEGDDVVGAWAPLKPATVAIRQSSNYPVSGEHPINRRSGELENWVVQGGWRAYPTNYGAAMQYPGSKPSGRLADKVKTAQIGSGNPNTVPRPVIGVNENDMLYALAALELTIEAVIR